MMISAFARESRLPVDTVRFYVRRKLLHPKVGQKGGSRPYQIFTATDLENARIIRAGQALGLSLEEIRAFLKEHPPGGTADSRLLAFLADRRGRLVRKAAELQKLISFLDAKMVWVRKPEGNVPPPFPGTD